MHILIYYAVKHLIRGLVILGQHLFHLALAAHAAVLHAVSAHTAAAHTAAAHTLGGTQAAGGVPAMAAMPAAQAGGIPLSSTAAALHGYNVQSSIMASVGQQQAANIPVVGDFS